MRAVVCREFKDIDDLEIGQLEPQPLTPDGVRIQVGAAGLNFPDVLMIQGKYQVKPPPPFVPGMEGAGTVLEVGPDVRGLKPGQRVMGFGGGGGWFAEQTVMPQASVYPIPGAMPFEIAAGFPVVYGTSHYALSERAKLKPGEVLVVHGASGGVGMTAVELGLTMGATVIGTGGSEEKLQAVTALGAAHVINYSRESIRDRVLELTGGRGADVIYDAVGGDCTDQSMRCIARNGRLLVIGFTSGRIPTVKTNLPLLKECTVIGVAFRRYGLEEPAGHRAAIEHVLALWSAGKLRPHVSQIYALADVKQAMAALMARRVIGKVVLTNQGDK
jgi:NADPH:quinone reductase